MDEQKYELTVSKKTEPLLDTANQLLNEAQLQQVKSVEDITAAKALVKKINNEKSRIKDMRFDFTRPLDRLKEAVMNREREIALPLDTAKSTLSTKILDFEAEQERKAEAERQRIADIEGDIRAFYSFRLNSIDQVKERMNQLSAYMLKLDNKDFKLGSVVVAHVNTKSRLEAKIEDIRRQEAVEIERMRQAEEDARLRKEAEKQSAAEAEIARKQAAQAAEDRRIKQEREQLEIAKRKQERERQELEAEKKAEAERKRLEAEEAKKPKINAVTHTGYEIVNEDAVPRFLCSPDSKKINAWIKASPQLKDGDTTEGIKIVVTTKVR